MILNLGKGESVMFKILNKKVLHENILQFTLEAPLIARKAEPGQFVVLRVNEYGERVPLTIADFDREKGTIDIIFMVIGASTTVLASLNAGDSILDLVGPLGKKTDIRPDMGTALIIIGIPTIMYFIAGLSKKWIGIICGIGFILLTLLATFQPYRLDRINSWYDPWSRSQEDGYQIVQSILAIGSGGFSGMGLGHGFSKYSYLPESHTDFAFAVFCQEIGFMGAFIVFLLLIALAFYCIKIALRTKDNFGKMLVCGITLLIVGQATGNMAMVIGIVPVVGVPLPFISYGGTSLILNMISIGLVLSVDRHNHIIKKSTKNETITTPPIKYLSKKKHLYRLK